MSSYTYLLVEGEKVNMDVNPAEIHTVAIVLEDGQTIYAVAGTDEEEKLISLQQDINQENQVISLMQFRDQSLSFDSSVS